LVNEALPCGLTRREERPFSSGEDPNRPPLGAPGTLAVRTLGVQEQKHECGMHDYLLTSVVLLIVIAAHNLHW
jgi:hypothetical protein